MKLIFPRGAAEATAHRAACLNHRAVQVEILEWSAKDERPKLIEWRDYGNVETRLAPHRLSADLIDRHNGLLCGCSANSSHELTWWQTLPRRRSQFGF